MSLELQRVFWKEGDWTMKLELLFSHLWAVLLHVICITKVDMPRNAFGAIPTNLEVSVACLLCDISLTFKA